LRDYICALSPLPVRDLTCTGERRVERLPADLAPASMPHDYAKALLSQPPCMRMVQVEERDKLTLGEGLRGIIYNTVSFCDYYGAEYGALRERRELPILKIEHDYTPKSQEQIKTRLQAFFESLRPGQVPREAKRKEDPAAQRYYAGIDSGSTSTNAVIVNRHREVVAFASVPTGTFVGRSAQLALQTALEQGQIPKGSLAGTVTTGYGRAGIDFRSRDITEITCHARGAHHLNPSVRTVIDIGGQDSKVIRLDKNGHVRSFVMNDKCAAGTGRFLEMMAHSLDLSLEEMSAMGADATADVTISSMCSVFAQSEVVSLVAKGVLPPDIVWGVNRSVAAKVLSMAGKNKPEGAWMITGGVARNPGVVAALEEKLGGALLLPPRAGTVRRFGRGAVCGGTIRCGRRSGGRNIIPADRRKQGERSS
jgi:predicted CoA-substrate-specific enzyme activase